jgi:hypothetical protein
MNGFIANSMSAILEYNYGIIRNTALGLPEYLKVDVMPYTPKQRTKRQRQRRTAGQVKRFEIVLSAENQRDHEIHDFLSQLPRGEISNFVKDAILEKIQRSTSISVPPDPADQLNAILSELAKIRQAVKQPAPVTPVYDLVTVSSDSTPVSSSGLDMSRPRRKRAGENTPPPKPTTLPEQAFDAEEARRKLLDSIHAYSKEF